MALVPVTAFGNQFTNSEVIFLAALADHTYTDGQLIIGNSATGGISFNTLTQGSGITITNGNGTITIASVSGGGDFSTNTATSVVNEIVLFADTTGKLGKRSTGTGIATLTSGVLSATATNGTGNVVLTTSATLVTPILGIAAATSINKVTITTPATGSTLTIADGKTLTASVTMTLQGGDASILSIAAAKTLTVSNSLTFTGTDGNSFAFPSGSDTVVTLGATQTLTAKTLTSPTLTTPTLGVATATSINKVTITAPVTSATLTLVTGSTLVTAGAFSLTLTTTATTVATFPTGTITLVDLSSSQALTTKSYNGLTLTSTTGTFTLTNAKTLAVTNSLTLSGTDSTVMTFPTTSKTIAANDGSNWTFASQAIGDIVTASSTTAYTRIAAVAVGAVLTAAGVTTQPTWSTAPQITTIELGNASDTTLSRSSAGVLAVEGVVIPSISSTNTLTNKRVTKRAPAITQSATPVINTDNTDVAHITGLAQAITSMTSSLTGTPVEGDTLRIDITDNGTARAITWGASFEASTVALPTTTVISTRLDVGFVWNTVTTKWRCVATA